MAYSTIRQKKGTCSHPGCGYHGALTSGMCNNHYWLSRRMKSAAKFEEKELQKDETLSAVIDDLDAVFSQFIRLRDSDENGYVTCPCCGAVDYWVDTDNMHFMKRGHMNTRFSEDNCFAGCVKCNRVVENGNIKAYGEFLEERRPGSVEALEDQARAPYKYDIPELKSLISFYSKEVRIMKAKKPLKI